MRLYLDTSVLLKLFVDEPDSEAVETLCVQAEGLFCARITLVEAHSALGRAHLRQGRLGRTDYATARAELERFWPTVAVVATDEAVLATAQLLGGRYGLRAYDAVQLASALAVSEFNPMFLSDDAELCDAVRGEGLNVGSLGG